MRATFYHLLANEDHATLFPPDLPGTKLKVKVPCQADLCLIKEKLPREREIASASSFKAAVKDSIVDSITDGHVQEDITQKLKKKGHCNARSESCKFS